MLGYKGAAFTWTASSADSTGIVIHFPSISINKLPSHLAWVLKLENLGNPSDVHFYKNPGQNSQKLRFISFNGDLNEEEKFGDL